MMDLLGILSLPWRRLWRDARLALPWPGRRRGLDARIGPELLERLLVQLGRDAARRGADEGTACIPFLVGADGGRYVVTAVGLPLPARRDPDLTAARARAARAAASFLCADPTAIRARFFDWNGRPL
jgi:hypothetical protein